MERQISTALAERLWNSIAIADIASLREIIDPKAVWTMPGRSPLAGRHEGIDEILAFMARPGELADELQSSLLDVFVNDGGAVLRYSIHAELGECTLDTEHLFMIRVTGDRIVDATFAPVDQERYDGFWLGEETTERAASGGLARILPFKTPSGSDA